MTATGLDVFDKTLQTTTIWLDELMGELRREGEGRLAGSRSGLWPAPGEVRLGAHAAGG